MKYVRVSRNGIGFVCRFVDLGQELESEIEYYQFLQNDNAVSTLEQWIGNDNKTKTDLETLLESFMKKYRSILKKLREN